MMSKIAFFDLKRIKYVDVTKGIGISLIVIGHLWDMPYVLRKLIYSFHVPLFFFLSGYILKLSDVLLTDFNTILKKRFFRLIVPYLSFALTSIVLMYFTGDVKSNDELFKRLYGIFYSIGTKEYIGNSPLWFLTTLFSTEILFLLIIRNINEKLIPLIIVACAILGYSLALFANFRLPWNFDVALTAIVFYYLGTVLRQSKFLQNCNYEIILALFFFLICIIINFLCPDMLIMSNNKLINIAYLYAGSISGIIAVFLLSYSIKKNKLIEFLGLNTLTILGFNYMTNFACDTILAFFGIKYWYINLPVQMVLLVLIILTLNKVPILNFFYNGRTIGHKRLGLLLKNNETS